MESYLVGEDLWDVVSTNGVVAPANIIENVEAFKKWKQQNARAEFVLKRSISHGIFEHIIGCESAREIWQTLDRLFNKKNEARLQMLENELAVTKQEGWAQQPSLEELENLLSSQESLAKQMATTSIKEEPKSALFVHDSGKGIITVDNTIHKIQKEGTVVIDNNRGESITLNSVYHVSGIQKNLFSVANAVDAGNFVLFGPRDVKFLRNVKEIKADVVHTGTRVNDLFVLSASNSYIEKMSSNDNSSLWHARLGHLNMTKLKVMIQRKLVDGLPDLSKVEDGKICEGCQFGKAHRLPFKSSNSRCTTPLERIHSDLMGPTLTASYSGCHYMLLFVDDYTRFTWVYFVKHKSETPQQNGVAERKIRHLVETCKCWLHAKNLSKALWAEGIKCAAYVINRVPHRSSNNKAPYELLFDAKPNVKYLRVFGSICYVHVSDSQRSKLDAKAIKCIFVGYDEQRKGWRCMDPTTNKCVVSRDVIFDEISSHDSADINKEENNMITLPLSHFSEDISKENQGEKESLCPNQDDGSQEEITNQHPRRNIVRPSRYRDDNFVTNFSCLFANPIDDDEPSSYDDAKGKRQGLLVIVLLYVDDIILTGSNYAEVTRLQEELSLRFDMKKLGELSNFLGLQIENLDKGIYVSQFSYAKRLIEKFGLIDGKKRSTPLDVNTRLHRDEGTCLSDPRPFRTLVGSLIYLTITRPDIAFSVGMVSRYMQEPRKPHFEEAKKILKYVNSTLNLGLLYEKGVEFSLQGFANADFGGDLDDRRSTSGFVFLRGATSISWCSKKQSSVSLSTTEAEYKASAQAAQECMWLRRLFEDLHVPIDQPIPIHGDNLSAIKLTSNPVFHARTKHIELEHHFIREKVLDGIIDMVAVKSEDHIADIFTKTLPKGAFEDLRSKLGLVLRTSL
ncbi:hypothetical protein ZIOFF_039589 [Zingiber officinale]|uniref:Uncharacterized protein n=1 Tax=Zingiber officinale TaxID=94328 RepID=A0A8J5L0A4_ZINOF|nr:hypothetical protein ZIOFF_039589 [Zingiber officinale]